MKKSIVFTRKNQPKSRWSICSESWWSVCSETSGQFTPNLGGQFDRFFQEQNFQPISHRFAFRLPSGTQKRKNQN